MPARSKRIAQHIAKRILQNTRKHFGTLYADALEEEYRMENRKTSCVTSSMNVKDTPASREPIQTSAMPDPAARYSHEDMVRDSSPKRIAPSKNAPAVQTQDFPVGDHQIPDPTIKAIDAKDVSADFGWPAGSYPGDTRATKGDISREAVDRVSGSGQCPRCPQQGSNMLGKANPDRQRFSQFPGNLADSDAGN